MPSAGAERVAKASWRQLIAMQLCHCRPERTTSAPSASATRGTASWARSVVVDSTVSSDEPPSSAPPELPPPHAQSRLTRVRRRRVVRM